MKAVHSNDSASLLDIGDGVGLVQLHSPANTIDDAIVHMLESAVQEGPKHFAALVIASLGEHFSTGADLPRLLADSTEGNWCDAEQFLQALQNANMALKYGPLPVTASPTGYTLSAGCEICLHATRVHVSAGTRMGLVEAHLGLIPAGGGTKELLLRALSRSTGGGTKELVGEGGGDPMPFLKNAFDLITGGNVSVSGEEALRCFLSPADTICVDENLQLRNAKQIALELVMAGHQRQKPEMKIRVLGWAGMDQFQKAIETLRSNRTFTEHDALIGRHVARVLCGGEHAAGRATEQDLLDLERESFLFLLGHRKTRERIQYMLKRNKRLRN